VSIHPSVVRTSHPFLLGGMIQYEVDLDIQIPKVDKNPYTITKDDFTSKEPINPSLGIMMEQDRTCIINKWMRGK
jgi:hypothetical protein